MNRACRQRLTPTGLLVSAFSILGCATTAGTDGADYVTPKTEFGHPDLRGVWNFSSNTPLQRPKQYGDKEFLTPEELAAIRARELERREESDGEAITSGVGGYNQVWVESMAQGENLRTSLIIDPPDGRMPALTEDAVVHSGGLGPDSEGEPPVRFRVGGVGKDGPEYRGLSERCLMGFNSGPPFMPSMYNNNVQIFQTEQHAVILTEMIHDARIVPLDGQPHLPEALRQWSGDSRGYWDGDTLVVETRNFTDMTQSFRSAGIGSNLHLVERFTRVADDQVDYQFTINDPKTFTQPITVLVPMVPADQLFEYACHEGNYGMVNILGGARKEEADTAKAK